jgi:pantoate--beta-alanine ligase
LQVVVTKVDLRTAVRQARQAGRKIGLTPTMGALHAGHLSLVEASRGAGDYVVATIYVNPTQFGPNEDFRRYPRPLDADLAALQTAKADLVFVPETAEVYRPGHATFVNVGAVAETLEGSYRPGHFRGVATVVLKLFHMAAPDRAYFGQKDYQQTLVVRRLVADLDLPVEVCVCPTVREPDGLAMSSRNAYLSADERRQATVLYRSLRRALNLAANGERNAAVIHRAAQDCLHGEPQVKLDYLAIVDRETLEPLNVIDRPALIAIAARVGATRLIDNVLFDPGGWPSQAVEEHRRRNETA